MSTFDNSEPKKTNSYDSAAPPNLLSFMLKDWKPASTKPVPALKTLKYFRARREALSAKYPGELLAVPSGHLKIRSNDTTYPFRPSSDFFYLTGCLEPDCVLFLVPEGSGHRPVLFVEPNPGKTTSAFFTDRHGELWTGPRPGVPQYSQRFGIDDCRGLPDLGAFLQGEAATCAKKARVLRDHSGRLEAQLASDPRFAATGDKELATTLSEMRLIKDEQEVRELVLAIAATKKGFEDVIARLKIAKTEREIEGVFYTRARMEGNDVGYGTIAAAGHHGCTLHWTRNDGVLKKTDLLLLDAGVEGHALYTADVTRTFPMGGRYSREQRQIYELVHAAQAAALKQVKPGNDFMDPNRAAMTVLAHGLEKLGILPTSAEEALKQENQFYKRYSLHNVSHMLGIDVHDCAQARQENYKHGKLKAGMVLTVEPGLYFQLDDLTVPAKYRGIGIRIEDDVLVTAKGYRNLSAALPSEASAVEKWMKSIWAKKKT